MKHYTKSEAKALVGRMVRVRRKAFWGGLRKPQPVGTTGLVIRIEHCENDEYDLIVRWDLPRVHILGKMQPQEDWFIREEFESLLEQTGHEVALAAAGAA